MLGRHTSNVIPTLQTDEKWKSARKSAKYAVKYAKGFWTAESKTVL